MEKTKSSNFVILILIVHACAFFMFFRFELFLDGYPYAFWGHSIFFTRDIQMHSQYSLMPGSLGVNQLNDNGYGNNLFPMGHSLVYMPMFAVSCLAENFSSAVGSQPEDTGYSQTTYFNYLIMTFFLCLASNIILFFLLKRFFTQLSSFFASIFIFFGTVIFGYSYLIPSFSHMTSFFFTLLLVFTFTARDMKLNERFYIYSALSSLMIIIRYDALIYLIIPLYDFFRLKAFKKPRMLLVCLFIFAVILSPQLISFYVLNGNFTLSSHEDIGSLFHGISANFLKFFTHPSCGAFTLTPLLIIAFAGFFAGLRKINYSLIFLLIMAFEYLQISLRIDMISGTLYGMRRFYSSLIFLSFGLSWLYDYFRKKGILSFMMAAVATALLTFYYLSSITLIDSGQLRPDTPLSFSGRLLLSLEGLSLMIKRGFLSRVFNIYLLKENIAGFLASIGLISILSLAFAFFLKRCSTDKVIKTGLILLAAYIALVNSIIFLSYAREKDFTVITVDEKLYGTAEGNTQPAQQNKAGRGKTPFNAFISNERDTIKLSDHRKFWGEKYKFGHTLDGQIISKNFRCDLSADFLTLVFTVRYPKRDIIDKKAQMANLTGKMEFYIDGLFTAPSESDTLTVLADIQGDTAEIRERLTFSLKKTCNIASLLIRPNMEDVCEIKLTGICAGQW